MSSVAIKYEQIIKLVSHELCGNTNVFVAWKLLGSQWSNTNPRNDEGTQNWELLVYRLQTAYCARMLSFCLWNQFKLPFSTLCYVYLELTESKKDGPHFKHGNGVMYSVYNLTSADVCLQMWCTTAGNLKSIMWVQKTVAVILKC